MFYQVSSSRVTELLAEECVLDAMYLNSPSLDPGAKKAREMVNFMSRGVATKISGNIVPL